MNTGAWIRIDRPDPERRAQESVRGVTVWVKISPYDQPIAFRGYYVPERGVFRIEFKYRDDEPGRARRCDDCVSLEVGLHSEKLLAIEVAVDKHKLDAVALVVEAVEQAGKAVKRLERQAQRASARLNYNAVDAVLQQTRHDPTLLTPA